MVDEGPQETRVGETSRCDLGALRRRRNDFRRVVARRNLREMFAAGVVVAFFLVWAIVGPDLLVRLGAALIALGGILVARTIYTRGQPPEAEPAATAGDLLAQWRADLVHQAELLEDVRRWYLAPFVPGCALVLLGTAWRVPWWRTAVVAAVLVAVLVSIDWLNARAARSLRAEAEGTPEA